MRLKCRLAGIRSLTGSAAAAIVETGGLQELQLIITMRFTGELPALFL